jgi:uncharacterized RDD family membrane protein YckC
LPDPELPVVPPPVTTNPTSIEPPIERRVEPPINRSITRPIQPITEPTVEPAPEPVIDPIKEPVVTQPLDIPIARTLDRPLDRPVSTEGKADLLDLEIDRPLVKVPAAPRAPLSVRRPPDQPRAAKPEPEIGSGGDHLADRDLLDDLDLFETDAAETRVATSVTRRSRPQIAGDPARPAGVIGRSTAAILDASFLAAVSSAVLWITMQVCGLTMADLPALPLLAALPLVLFLLMIDFGYLALFTAAGGQTLGKMAARIRVIGTSAATGQDERLDIPRAAFRSVVALPSVLALGAGFLPALGGDRRAVHDRLAHTRVVRV